MSIVGGSYLRSNQAAVKSRVSLPLESVGTPSHNLNHTSQGDHSVSSTHRLFQNIKLTKNKNEGRVTQHVPKKSDEFDSMSVQDNQRFRWGDRDYPSESSPINEKPTSLFRREAFAAPSQALFNWPQDSSSPVNLELKASAPDLKKQEEPSFNPVATRATPPIQLDSKAGRVGDLQSLRNHPNNKSNLSTDRNEKSTGRSRIKTRNHTLDPILQQSLLTRVAREEEQFDGPSWVRPKARKQALSNTFLDNFKATKTTFFGTNSQQFQATHPGPECKDGADHFLTHTDFNRTDEKVFRQTGSQIPLMNKTAGAGFKIFDYSLNKTVRHPTHVNYRSFHPEVSPEQQQQPQPVPGSKGKTPGGNFSFYLQDRTNLVQKDGEFSFDLKRAEMANNLTKQASTDTAREETNPGGQSSSRLFGLSYRRKLNKDNMFVGLKPSILLRLKNLARKVKREVPLLFIPNWVKALCDPKVAHTKKASPTTNSRAGNRSPDNKGAKTLSLKSGGGSNGESTIKTSPKGKESPARSSKKHNLSKKGTLERVEESMEDVVDQNTDLINLNTEPIESLRPVRAGKALGNSMGPTIVHFEDTEDHVHRYEKLRLHLNTLKAEEDKIRNRKKAALAESKGVFLKIDKKEKRRIPSRSENQSVEVRTQSAASRNVYKKPDLNNSGFVDRSGFAGDASVRSRARSIGLNSSTSSPNRRRRMIDEESSLNGTTDKAKKHFGLRAKFAYPEVIPKIAQQSSTGKTPSKLEELLQEQVATVTKTNGDPTDKSNFGWIDPYTAVPADETQNKRGLASYEGFTSIKVDMKTHVIKILRSVKMYGLEAIDMTIEDLIRRFVKNWKSWAGAIESRPNSHSLWIESSCRYKNIFLRKLIIQDEPTPQNPLDKTVKAGFHLDPLTEKTLAEFIFGVKIVIRKHKRRVKADLPNQTPRSKILGQSPRGDKSGLMTAKTPRSAQLDDSVQVGTEPSILANLVFAPDRTYDTVKSILEDLIELNYLIEFESLRNKEEQYKIMCEGYGVQAKKNMDVFRHVKNYINRNYWKHGESRMEFERVMKMIKQEANYNPFATRGFSIIDQIDMFEKQYGRMEHLGLKSRVCAQHIVKNSTMQLETLLRGKAAEQKVPVKTIEEVRDELREKIRSGETPGSVLQRFASIAEYNRDESSESPSVSPASSPRSRKLISPISKTNKMNF